MMKNVFQSDIKKFERTASWAHRFSRNEDGGVFTIFVVVGFILIFATAGIGVDIMNFERDRASLQGTLDRAVLAAANVKQTLPPAEVVKSYIEKSDVRGQLTKEPEVVPGIGSRKVTANAEVDVKTHFMAFFGYPTLKASVTSVAEESIGSIEIALVLDISGSMSRASATEGTTKIKALQDAAIQFVNTMYLKENPDKISISIIPYNNQVNAGENILSNMPGVTTEHDYSHCVDFTDDDFEEYWIDPNERLRRAAHFDVWNRYDSYDEEARLYEVCTTRAGSAITPVTNIVSDLHDQINAMTPGGNTSIDIGVKWGAALLDPQFQPVINRLSKQIADPGAVNPDTGLDVNTGEEPKKVVPTTFDNRPMAYEAETKKIMIVMTDGENTENWVLNDAYRDGYSDVWYNPNFEQEVRNCWYNRWGRLRCNTNRYSGEYSVRTSEDPPRYYWTRHEEQNETYDNTEPYGGEGEGQSVRLTYPELWNRVNLDWNAAYNYAWQPGHNTTWYDDAFTEIYRTEKDTRLQNICSKVKSKNVDIYGIAFEAPSVGVTAIKNCSSGDSFFFSVNGSGNLDGATLGSDNLTLSQVFDSIATAIKRLRLTQ